MMPPKKKKREKSREKSPIELIVPDLQAEEWVNKDIDLVTDLNEDFFQSFHKVGF